MGTLHSTTFRVALDLPTLNAMFDGVAASFVKQVEGFAIETIFDDSNDRTVGEIRNEIQAVIDATFAECSKLRIFELPYDTNEAIFWGRLLSSLKTHADKGFFKWDIDTNGKPFARIVGRSQFSNE